MTLYAPAAVERAENSRSDTKGDERGDQVGRDGRHSHRNSASGYAFSPVMAIQTHIER